MRARAGALLAVPLALVLAGGALGAPFAPRASLDVRGDVTIAANTSVTCPAADPACAAAQAGSGAQNNAFAMTRVDADADPTTFDSSSARLALPAGASVRFAGLYWGARTSAGQGGAPPPDPTALTRALLAPPAGGYVPVAGALTGTGTVAGGAGYQAFADVTALVRAGGAGAYTVANVQAATGQGSWGGWTLVVAYEDPGLPLRSLTVFDGYQPIVAGQPGVTVPVAGFITPASGPVSARVGLVAYEGDRGFTGDAVTLGGAPLSGPLNPAADIFRGAISLLGVDPGGRAPGYADQLGLDAALLSADGVLPNGATGTTVSLATTGDDYALGVVTTAIDLNAPDVRLAGQAVDLNGGALLPGDEIEYRLSAVNRGADDAVGVVLEADLPSGTEPLAGPLRLDAGALSAGASTAGTFRVRVAAGTPPGSAITLRPRAAYAGRTLGTPFETFGDPVTLVVAAPPAPPAPPATPASAPPRVAGPARVGVSVRGPARARGGQTLTYLVRVVNRGGRPARAVEVQLALPARLRPLRAVAGLLLAERSMRARLPVLAPGRAQVFRVRLMADRLASGPQRVAVRVTAPGAGSARAAVRSVLAPGPSCPPIPG